MKLRNLVALFAVSFLTACGSGGGGTTDTSLAPAPAPAAAGLTNKYYTTTVGNSWTTTNNNGATATLSVISADELKRTSSTSTNSTVFKFVDVAGALHLSEKIISNATGQTINRITYSPALPYIPASLAAGTLTGTSTETTYIYAGGAATGATTTAAITITITPAGTETITVPAGTFSTDKYTWTITNAGITNIETIWFAAGRGQVQEDVTATERNQLTSFSVQ